ncbi:restriction endonuclease subunit S [Ligilactobacillus salivarius]|uniref:restriction endonuclease subunit S n=1 Tax=Ligilactobacillus salivarius TaxID=1624 RepID=UPI00187992A5|nr:restriction endonuclease subunit S [Ligilactobacillus salivarius]MBE7386497.1 restriction endonuclease subunit S [Ligilactobacillus salivarius]
MEKEEKKAPKLRFNGYTNDWERKKLGDVAKITPGGTPSKNISNYWYPKEIPWLSSGEINKEIIFSTDGMISKKGFNNSSAKWIKQDSVLIALAGQGKTRGKVAINRIPLTTNQSIAGIEPSNEVYYKFLYHQLTKDYLKLRLISSGDGSRGGLNKKLLNDYAVNLSSIDEQHKLGILLSHIDNTLQLHERKYEELALIKKALLQKLFPKNDEVAPEVRYKNFNDAWEQRKLGEVGKTFTGLSGKTKEDFGHGDAHFVTYMNVYSNPISDPNMVENVEIDTKQQEVKKGDVFFTTSSETPEEVGMSSVWLSDAPHIYLNSFCFGFRPTVNIFHPYYLAYLLRSNNIRNKMMILAQGISRYNISKNKVMKLNVTIPNIREQQKIGEFFKQLDFLITLHHRKLEKLKQLKKFLLQNMFI